MKLRVIIFLELCIACTVSAQPGDGTNSIPGGNAPTSAIVERGDNHRVWERVTSEELPNGQQVERKRQVTELASGLHYFEEGQWKESREEIEPFPEGAIARQGQHKVIFASDLATLGAIDVETPTGARVRSHVLGLSYFDTQSGQSVLIAEVTNCLGEVEGPNVVIYRNAFTDLEADVRYTYRRGGFEQDVILRERPASPAEYGLNPATTKLQVLTEFVNPPVPERTEIGVGTQADCLLDFGQWKIVPGRAYSEPNEDGVTLGGRGLPGGTPVRKDWVKLEGRDFLIEEVELPKVQAELQALPQGQASIQPGTNSVRHIASVHRLLPAKPRLASAASKQKMRVATQRKPTKGFVMDYTTISGSVSDQTFKGDTTYYISGPVNLLGTTVIEGGAVLKFTNTVWSGTYLSQPYLGFYGKLECRTSPYRLAILTAKDDDTVGETINGSTGVPDMSSTYAYCGMYLAYWEPSDVHDIRFSYMGYGIQLYDSTNILHSIRDCQFTSSERGVYAQNSTVALQNLLFYKQSVAAIFGRYSTISGEHLTFDQVYRALEEGTLGLTNSILVLVSNTPTGYTSVNNFTGSVPASVFQTVGVGAHYLIDGSTNRNVGTTNISANLLARLRTKTTCPPILFSAQQLTNSLTFYPQAQRDTDLPDLGYHYDPLDYGFSLVWFKNATMTVQPGTALACYGVNSGSYGIALMGGSVTSCIGKPEQPNWIATLNTVQEQAVTNQSSKGYSIIGDYLGDTPVAQAFFRFTDWSRPAQDNSHFQDWSQDVDIAFRDCEFYGGKLQLYYPDVSATNCLFSRVQTEIDDAAVGVPFNVSMFNNLFNGGNLRVDHADVGEWRLRDNAFIGVGLIGAGDTISSNNAYLNCTNRLTPNASSDVILTNFTFVSGPLGSFYQYSTDLLGEGSRTADLAGLYHYTTTTNQLKETNSVVDIGYHYVAVTNMVSIDTDGDGVPDYLEDSNGDGSPSGDASSWLSYDSTNGLTLGNGLKVFTPLK